ncbi:hypothetical protein B0J14DRAFT_607549 [Halenospora varia]|nr:hypothetical protein B0J14DRAFT_607549 [Halenospora varia]
MPPSTHSFFSRSSRTSTDEDDRSLLPRHERRLPSFSLQDLSPREHTSLSPAASPSPPPSFYRDTLNNNTASAGLEGRYKDAETEGSVNGRERSRGSSSRGGIRSLDGGEDVGRQIPSSRRRKIQFSAPPPPIATSILLPSSPYTQAPPNSSIIWAPESSSQIQGRTNQRQGVVTDPLLGLERRERAIQKELQVLLDAQSAGLIQGFGGHVGGEMNGGDEGSEAGSSTPTSRSMLHVNSGSRDGSRNGHGRKTSSGVVPVRQPKRKKIGLRGARRGLLGDMGELVLVKAEEISILEGEMLQRESVLLQVKNWEERIEGARERLSGYSATGVQNEGGGEAAMELAELQTEERAVENEIREVEDRLAQMKARRGWLRERIREGINRQEAMLSGYRGALREAENEVKQFLKRPPIPVSVVMGEEEGFMALPVGRRTLGMAGEWWSKELSQLELRKKETENEKMALEEGAKLWKESIKIVNDFEDDLRKQMASGQNHGPEMLEKQIGKMRAVIDKLSQTAKTAEEKKWNLLICAVGAELEAFKEGEAILRRALGMVSPSHADNNSHEADSHESEHNELGRTETQTSLTSNESLLNELNEAALETEIENDREAEMGLDIEREVGKDMRESSFRTAREESEDEGPPVELLVDGGYHGEHSGEHSKEHSGEHEDKDGVD